MPRGGASLEKTFSAEYDDHKEDTRRARQKHGKYATRHGPGVGAELQANPRHGDVGASPDGLSNEDLRRKKELQPLLSLRKTMRQRLLGRENPEIETALFKANRMARKNAKLGKDHEKGFRKKTQRPGQGKYGDVENPNSRGFVTSTHTVQHSPAFDEAGQRRAGGIGMKGYERRAAIAFTEELAGVKDRAALQLAKVKLLLELRDEKGAVSAAALRRAGQLPSTPAANVSAAAVRLHAVQSEQRPTTLMSLANWLTRQRCCKLHYKVLLPPGALAAAMIPFLTEHPRLAVTIDLLTSAAGSDEHGPSLDACAQRAKEVTRQLLQIELQFLGWPLAMRVKWIAGNSWLALVTKPEELAAEMLRRGFIGAPGANGRFSYDDDLLAAEVQPQDGDWMSQDFPMSTCVVGETNLELGSQASAELRTQRLRARGLDAACKDWQAAALHALIGEGNGVAPAVVIVSAELEPPSWPMHVRLVTAITGGKHEDRDAFLTQVQRVAVEDLETNEPLLLELGDMNIRPSLLSDEGRQLRRFQRIFGCIISMRQESSHVYVVFPKIPKSQVSSDQFAAYKEVLLVAFAAAPAFRCPGVVPSSIATILEGNFTLSKAGEDIGTRYELSSATTVFGSCDLLGWPGPAAFGLNLGVEGAMGRYKAAVETARSAGFEPITTWVGRSSDGYSRDVQTALSEAFDDADLTVYAGEVAEAKLLSGGKVRIGRW